MTVMAPDNNAFTAYLSEHNYSTVKDIPARELKELIGFHLLYYSYNKGSMENFRPEGEGAYDEGTEILDPGLYYKFRTRSSGEPTREVSIYTKFWTVSKKRRGCALVLTQPLLLYINHFTSLPQR